MCLNLYLYFRESPLKPGPNVNSIMSNTWAYKTKSVDSVDLFAQDHFLEIKRKKEITLALNVCKEINIEQKIGAKVVRRSLENIQKPNLFKFNDQVLRGFAITWHNQVVVHYVDFIKTGLLFLLSNT